MAKSDEILMSVFKQTTNNVVKPQCSIVFIVQVDGIFRGHHYIRGRGPIGIYRDEKLFHIQAPLKYIFFTSVMEYMHEYIYGA